VSRFACVPASRPAGSTGCSSLCVTLFPSSLMNFNSSFFIFSPPFDPIIQNVLGFLDVGFIPTFNAVHVALLQTSKSLCYCIQLIGICACFNILEVLVLIDWLFLLVQPINEDKT